MLALSPRPSVGQPLVRAVCVDVMAMDAALLEAIPQFICESVNNTSSRLVTFSKYVDAALQLLCNQGKRVFCYLDDLIVIARTKKWAMFHTSQLTSCILLSWVLGSTAIRAMEKLWRGCRRVDADRDAGIVAHCRSSPSSPWALAHAPLAQMVRQSALGRGMSGVW